MRTRQRNKNKAYKLIIYYAKYCPTHTGLQADQDVHGKGTGSDFHLQVAVHTDEWAQREPETRPNAIVHHGEDNPSCGRANAPSSNQHHNISPYNKTCPPKPDHHHQPFRTECTMSWRDSPYTMTNTDDLDAICHTSHTLYDMPRTDTTLPSGIHPVHDTYHHSS